MWHLTLDTWHTVLYIFSIIHIGGPPRDVITCILDEEGSEEEAEEESDAVGDTAERPRDGQEGAQASVVEIQLDSNRVFSRLESLFVYV